MGWLGPRCSITTESDGRVGCSPPLLILSENYRYVLLNHERYCENVLEIMLHVFIDILCIYVNMYSLICCVYTLIILALNN